MKVISSTNDGFIISEKDLELRGSGEFFGTKQHGIPEFKIANLFEDIALLKQAQGIAIEIIDKDPLLESEENKLLKKFIYVIHYEHPPLYPLQIIIKTLKMVTNCYTPFSAPNGVPAGGDQGRYRPANRKAAFGRRSHRNGYTYIL